MCLQISFKITLSLGSDLNKQLNTVSTYILAHWILFQESFYFNNHILWETKADYWLLYLQ